MKRYVLYNPLSNNKSGQVAAEKLKELLSDSELVFQDITQIESYPNLFAQLDADDEIVICGGDGTLNHFANDIKDMELKHTVLYYAAGTGNDFLHDLNMKEGAEPFPVNQYLKHLPTVIIDERRQLFLNGIGYGLDGYCCEVADKIKEKSDKPINYTAIAIKGLLFDYKPTSAKVTIDGKVLTFKKAWLVPTMNGRFFGGGIMITPQQNRLDNDMVSVGIVHDSARLRTLMIFPKLFTGKHVKYTKVIEIHTGKDITVEFDRPTALQIDGETVLGVTKYQVLSAGYSES